jgi:hypothetical protein
MTNYNPKHEPSTINELILEHIDFVMYDECEKSEEDNWTLANILSWERFGNTICYTCHNNREKLLNQLIREWQSEYDYIGVIRRGVTEYKELPYKIKSMCERIAMNNVKKTEWGLDDMYEYGRKFYMREIEQSEVIDLRISNAINERNIEYLINRFDKFEKHCITKENITTKKQFPHL